MAVIQQNFKSQLPRRSHNRWAQYGVLFTLAFGVVGIWIGRDNISINIAHDPAVIVCSLVTLSVIVLSIVFGRRSRQRYSEALMHLHYAVHIVRDYCAKNAHSREETERVIVELLDSCSRVFGIITRKNTLCSIKKYNTSDNTVQYYLHDQLADRKNGIDKNIKIPSDQFASVTYFLEKSKGARRYCRQNVQSDFRHNRYFHPSLLGADGPRNYNNFRQKYQDWPLHFSSTLVVPIRYISEDDAGELIDNILGFLCVDSESRGVFNEQYDSEIAATYADLIHLLLTLLTRDMGNVRDNLGA